MRWAGTKSCRMKWAVVRQRLRNDIVPFIITEEKKLYYYRGLKEWDSEKGYLRDTCLAAQDELKAVLDYFRIPYAKEE